MATITEVITNALSKVKTEVTEVRWLRGHRYVLLKIRSKADGVQYQWAYDQFNVVGIPYRSKDMANVHFGEWDEK